MAVQPGFDDLKPKRVLTLNEGYLVCIGEDGRTHQMELYVGSSGSIIARPIEIPVDQSGDKRRAIPYDNIDQNSGL